jgi:hypothetical protein
MRSPIPIDRLAMDKSLMLMGIWIIVSLGGERKGEGI